MKIASIVSGSKAPTWSAVGRATATRTAWRRIAARGLAHQPKTVVDKTSGTLVIPARTDAVVC
jgi:hypothetical protein